jgi:Na+/citrate or Na+/malate symporter
MAAFTVANLVAIVATVFTLMATGAVIGRWMDLYPIDAAIVMPAIPDSAARATLRS